MPDSPRRLIALEGCLNFRDLGGYTGAGGRRLRWGQLFRSDALHHLTPADVGRLRDEVRLGAIVDLRTSGELESEGRGPLEAEPIRFHHIPLFEDDLAGADPGGTLTLADRYTLMLEVAHRAIARVVATLATAEAPAVFHCAAGKDRTGVISAVLLGLLGVPDEIIVADYALTQRNLERIVARLASTAGYKQALEALPPDTLHATPETMAELLVRLRRRHGSVQAYARSAGVPEPALRRLEERLLGE